MRVSDEATNSLCAERLFVLPRCAKRVHARIKTPESPVETGEISLHDICGDMELKL